MVWGEETIRRKDMTVGLNALEILVANPAQPQRTTAVEFLIDSGAIYSVVPSAILDDLGIKPLAEQSFRLADGSKIVRRKGVAVFKYKDQIGGADVIFGEEGDAMLLAPSLWRPWAWPWTHSAAS